MKGKLAIFKPVNSKSELMEIPNSQHREEGREEKKEEREGRKEGKGGKKKREKEVKVMKPF